MVYVFQHIDPAAGEHFIKQQCNWVLSKEEGPSMKSRNLMLLAVFLFAAGYCLAGIQLVTADIPFSFIAEGKPYPAGTYQFSMNDAESTVMIHNLRSAQEDGWVSIVTRLAPRSQAEAAVVFDVVQNDHYLSEIHVPRMDGFYFKSAPAKHTHVMVRSSRK
jgi:hypothetical protein